MFPFPISITASDRGLTRVVLNEQPGQVNDAPLIREATLQLEEYFAGVRRDFDLPLDLHGTEFQIEVWAALRAIPYGETRSYAAIARQIGRPSAVRAVGAANGANPIAIIVPCHRVIGSTGALTGYGGGLPLKRFLLALESQKGSDGKFPNFARQESLFGEERQ